jgi:hypothetical protein
MSTTEYDRCDTTGSNPDGVVNDGDLLNQVDVAVAQASANHLDDLVNTLNFPVINLLDLKHRTALGKEIVMRSMSPEDRAGIRNLAAGICKWHVISSERLPYDGNRETLVTLQYGALACLESHPFAFLEGAGNVDRRAVKRAGEEDTLTTGGGRPFGPHIDHAWGRFAWEPDDGRPVIPDFLTLGGFENPLGVGTAFADPSDLLSGVSELSRCILEKPEFSLPAPASVKPPLISCGIPLIVRGPDRRAVLRINPRILCETHRAADALEELKMVMSNPKYWHEIVLGPGDIVVARGTALHQRGAVNGPRELTAVYGRHAQTSTRVVSAANRHLEPVR